MPLLFHWVGANYRYDMSAGRPDNLNQNSLVMLRARRDERMWAFTRREDGTYVLALRGLVKSMS